MKYEGQNLANYLKTHNPSDDTRISIVHKVAHALEYGWQHKIIHHDVTPQSIRMVGSGDNVTPVLCDYGKAKPFSEFDQDNSNSKDMEQLVEILGVRLMLSGVTI